MIILIPEEIIFLTVWVIFGSMSIFVAFRNGCAFVRRIFNVEEGQPRTRLSTIIGIIIIISMFLGAAVFDVIRLSGGNLLAAICDEVFVKMFVDFSVDGGQFLSDYTPFL